MQLAEMGKAFLRTSSGFVNEPPVKQGIKNLTGTVSFLFGVLLFYDTAQRLKNRQISTEVAQQSPRWKQIAYQVAIASAKLSILLSAATTPPGSYILSTFARSCCSQPLLEKVFGKSAIFEVNPWHPRHVASLAAIALALPLILQSIGQGCISWDRKAVSILHPTSYPADPLRLTDTKLKLIIFFNALTSRLVLHQLNQWTQLLLIKKA